MTIRFDAYGPKAYSYGLVHYTTLYEALVCGRRPQYAPHMHVHKNEPISCFDCLVIGDPRRNA